MNAATTIPNCVSVILKQVGRKECGFESVQMIASCEAFSAEMWKPYWSCRAKVGRWEELAFFSIPQRETAYGARQDPEIQEHAHRRRTGSQRAKENNKGFSIFSSELQLRAIRSAFSTLQ